MLSSSHCSPSWGQVPSEIGCWPCSGGCALGGSENSPTHRITLVLSFLLDPLLLIMLLNYIFILKNSNNGDEAQVPHDQLPPSHPTPPALVHLQRHQWSASCVSFQVFLSLKIDFYFYIYSYLIFNHKWDLLSLYSSLFSLYVCAVSLCLPM